MNRFRSLTVVAVLSTVGFANGDGVALDDPRGVFDGASNGGGAYIAAPKLELVACGSECLHDSDDFLDYNLMFIPSMTSLRHDDVSYNGFSVLSNGQFRLVLGGGMSAWGEAWVGAPPLKWGELYAARSIHRCTGGVQEFCYACGRRHASAGGYACFHESECAAKADYTNSCTCAPLFVRVNWDDDNMNLTEDRLDQVVAGDDDDVVCCRAAGETRECCCGLIPSSSTVAGVAATAGLRLSTDEGECAESFCIEALAASIGIGTESVSYEVRDDTNGVLRTITRAVTAANLEIRPDFDDDGEVDADDRFGWRQDEAWQVRVRNEPYVLELVSECPTCADVSLVGAYVSGAELSVRGQGTGAAVLPLGETVRSTSFVAKNETRMLEVDTSGGPGILDLTYTLDVGGTRLTSTRRIHAVDASVGEQWTTPAAVDDVVYDYSGIQGSVCWAIYRCDDDECVDEGADNVFSPGELPPGNYRVEVYFTDLFNDGDRGYLSVGWLHVIDVRLECLYETSNPVNRIFNPTRKDDVSGNFTGEKEHAGTPNEERYAAPRNYLYVVGNSDTGNFNVSAQFDAIGAEGCTNYYCAFYNGESKIPGSETNVDFTADVVEFSIPATTTDAVDVLYQLRGGLDLNGDHSLDGDEATSFTVYTNSERRLKKAYVKGITREKYVHDCAAKNGEVFFMNDNPASAVLPHARTLLTLYYENGSLAHLNSNLLPSDQLTESVRFSAFSTDCTCFAEWLTHNSGHDFNAQGEVNITKYIWTADSEMSEFMSRRVPLSLQVVPQESNPFIDDAMPSATGERLMQYYDANVRATAESLLADADDGQQVVLPSETDWYDGSGIFSSLSPSWVPGMTLEIGGVDGYANGYDIPIRDALGNTDGISEFDAFGAIGRGRILNPRYRFTVRKEVNMFGLITTYKVVNVRFVCTLTDLYDFNYEDGGRAREAASLQIGYGCGAEAGYSGHGKIFMHEIRIDANYEDPF